MVTAAFSAQHMYIFTLHSNPIVNINIILHINPIVNINIILHINPIFNINIILHINPRQKY
jgi:hypothetical protein